MVVRPLPAQGQSLFGWELCKTLSLAAFSCKDGCGYPEFTVLLELEGSHQQQGAHPQQEALESEGFCDIPTSASQCDGDVML